MSEIPKAAVPHTFHLTNFGESLVAVSAKPCKRCGSTEEPTCDHDPWLDIGEPELPTPTREGIAR